MNKLEKEWKEEQLWSYFKDKNRVRLHDLAMDELIIKKSNLGWWRRNWNTKEDLDWVEKRTAELLNKEFTYEVIDDE